MQPFSGHASHILLILLGVMFCSLLSGCGLLQKTGLVSAPEQPEPRPVPLSEQPYQLKLNLSASSDLNPDTQSRPSPVQVRVFMTDGQSEIGSKEFEEMFDYAGAQIEPRPVSTLTLRPGQTTELTLTSNKAQTRLVIAAAFRDPYQTLWKAAARITPTDTVSVNVSIGANTVTISPER